MEIVGKRVGKRDRERERKKGEREPNLLFFS